MSRGAHLASVQTQLGGVKINNAQSQDKNALRRSAARKRALPRGALIENPRFMLIHSFQSADDKFALQPHSRPIF